MSETARRPVDSAWSELQAQPVLPWQRVLSRLSSQPDFWLLSWVLAFWQRASSLQRLFWLARLFWLLLSWPELLL